MHAARHISWPNYGNYSKLLPLIQTLRVLNYALCPVAYKQHLPATLITAGPRKCASHPAATATVPPYCSTLPKRAGCQKPPAVPAAGGGLLNAASPLCTARLTVGSNGRQAGRHKHGLACIAPLKQAKASTRAARNRD
jgi:hypothetical protein